ncbi:prophage PhiRv1 protein, partial [Mycobacterium tuberculosis BTB10-092]
ASFDENRHCYRRSPRHLRRHLPAAQTNRQRNPQRRQRNPPVRGETNGAAGRRIAELERPKAKERQREGGRLGASITNAGFGPMEPKPSQRHTDKEVGAALGISAGTYKRLKRIDNATRSDDKEIRLFAEKQMAPLAAGSPSWNGRKPSSGNRKAATMAARLDILAWGPWAPSQNRSVVRRKQTLLSAQPSASPPAPTGGSNESTTQPAASWRRGRPGTPKQRPPTPGPILPTR